MRVLDRLASDIANAGTAGYKAERATTTETRRPSFGSELQSAIDVSGSAAQLDLRAGTSAQTGRPLDVTIEGEGFFVIATNAGERYTRNGRFSRRADGVLATPDGQAVLGDAGPITLGSGAVQVDADGTVRHAGAVAGKLRIVSSSDARSGEESRPDVCVSLAKFARLGSGGPCTKEAPAVLAFRALAVTRVFLSRSSLARQTRDTLLNREKSAIVRG